MSNPWNIYRGPLPMDNGEQSKVLLMTICKILADQFRVESASGECLTAFNKVVEQSIYILTLKYIGIWKQIGQVKLMTMISGRPVINIFDLKPILISCSISTYCQYINNQQHSQSNIYSANPVPNGSIRILKRPAEYTYKCTVTKTLRPDDPFAIQKARSEQQHNIEENLRKSAFTERKYVNYEY